MIFCKQKDEKQVAKPLEKEWPNGWANEENYIYE